MKYIATTLALLSILELFIIFGLYLRIGRMTAEVTHQQEQLDELQTTLHIILNDREQCKAN